jgi:prophage regulatory protein
MSDKVLRLPAVLAITGLSKSTVYVRIFEGTFPQSQILGPRTVGWLESDINAWIKQQIEITRRVRGERAA